MNDSIKRILEDVQSGSLPIGEAILKLKTAPFEDIGYAKVDLHRALRKGVAEVIYGAGKTPEQIIGIADTLSKNNQGTILITRLEPEASESIKKVYKLIYHAEVKIGIIGPLPDPDVAGKIVVATGGTSDIPVAEEAALTAEVFGNEVIRLYDVGVAGLHRLLAHLNDIMSASVINCHCRYGRRACQRNRRACVLSGHCCTHECRLRRFFRRVVRVAFHASILVQAVFLSLILITALAPISCKHDQPYGDEKMKTLYLECGMGAAAIC